MTIGDDEPGIVCYVTPEGEVVCEDVMRSASQDALRSTHRGLARVIDASDGVSDNASPALKSALPAGTWGPNKIKLAQRILEVLASSDLPDDSGVPRRAGEIVDSVKHLLGSVPPSILLYNYSTQPANVMGAYYQNKGDLVRMQQVFKTFEHPKKP